MQAAVLLLSALGAVWALPNPTFLPNNKASGQQVASTVCGNNDEDWTPFTVLAPCNAPPCGTGVEVSFRRFIGVLTPTTPMSPECYQKSVPCTSPCPPPVDCVPGPWTAYSRCSALCNGGGQYRTRLPETEARYGGAPCTPDQLVEVQPCNPQPCDLINCVVSEWGDFSECSGPCGTKERKRTVIVPAEYGGEPCPSLCETLPCRVGACPEHNTQPSPVNCQVSEWSASSPCSAECKRTSTRSVTTMHQFGGVCPELDEGLIREEDCTDGECISRDCETTWSEWSVCSALCWQRRTRTITTTRLGNGAPCTGPVAEDRTCTGGDCPSN